ncbi:protoglobin domain-containing protein [Methylomonas koyamae]|uniref:protoglobin domain-containing protein n=1 Tax=Methylomonas koyamae TaxID=702114 RepID=UPI000BC3414B|nr:protoglobin domain-containing protein [Methylomonas koyamae]ATG89884.1 hypothetical protein MKLM6_1644 [Methylomonas koyamae]
MLEIDYEALTQYAKVLANFTPSKEDAVIEVGLWLKPRLGEVTESFYEKLMAAPETHLFLEGRVERLKQTHLVWLEKVFTGPYDGNYTAYLYNVGDVHVRVGLPVEFMAAGIALLTETLHEKIASRHGGDCRNCQGSMEAIGSMLGYSLIVMQKSYQRSMDKHELEKFLKISGISHALYQNMARSYKN